MLSANGRGLAGFAVAAVLVAGLASAQSMGDAAQRERERREKLKQKGDRSAVVASDELKGNKGALANDPNAAAPAPGSASPPPRASREPERRAGEQEWRKRMTLARERAARAQEQYDYWSSQHLGPSEYFVDQDGKKVIGSVESLRKVIAEARAELDKASAELTALEEQARRENVTPGWLR
jgi:hypothetical protein